MNDRIVVLGVGNPLMGDDGIGIEALTRLRESWVVPADVQLIDGGTWGMQLLPAFEAADEVLILDAIEAGRPPGSIVSLGRDELPRHLRLRVSPHHVDLEDVLALLEFRGTTPARMAAVGIQPASVSWGIGLSPPVEAAVPALVREVARRLAEAGIELTPRDPVHA